MVKNLDEETGEQYKTVIIGGKKVKVPILFILPEVINSIFMTLLLKKNFCMIKFNLLCSTISNLYINVK